jgi:hypothetical protein
MAGIAITQIGAYWSLSTGTGTTAMIIGDKPTNLTMFVDQSYMNLGTGQVDTLDLSGSHTEADVGRVLNLTLAITGGGGRFFGASGEIIFPDFNVAGQPTYSGVMDIYVPKRL